MSRLETRTVKRIDSSMTGTSDRYLQIQAKCPNCGIWGDIDEEQAAGSVSLVCGNEPNCTWHGYIDGRVA